MKALKFLAVAIVICSLVLGVLTSRTEAAAKAGDFRKVMLDGTNYVWIDGYLNLSDREIRKIFAQAKYPEVELPKMIMVQEPPALAGGAAFQQTGTQKFWIPLVTLHKDIAADHDTAKQLLTKELVGTAKVLSWAVRNPGYVDFKSAETLTFVDGAAFLATADVYNKTQNGDQPYWDGKSNPTCEHLLAIKKLADMNFIVNQGFSSYIAQGQCTVK